MDHGTAYSRTSSQLSRRCGCDSDGNHLGFVYGQGVGRLSAVLTITYQDNNNKNCPSYPERDLGRGSIVEAATVVAGGSILF